LFIRFETYVLCKCLTAIFRVETYWAPFLFNSRINAVTRAIRCILFPRATLLLLRYLFWFSFVPRAIILTRSAVSYMCAHDFVQTGICFPKEFDRFKSKMSTSRTQVTVCSDVRAYFQNVGRRLRVCRTRWDRSARTKVSLNISKPNAPEKKKLTRNDNSKCYRCISKWSYYIWLMLVSRLNNKTNIVFRTGTRKKNKH
jgi:hypothetical protein